MYLYWNSANKMCVTNFHYISLISAKEMWCLCVITRIKCNHLIECRECVHCVCAIKTT